LAGSSSAAGGLDQVDGRQLGVEDLHQVDGRQLGVEDLHQVDRRPGR